jgi:hypothetical protein
MDDADISEERVRVALEADVAKLREAAARIPVGTPGECDLCGEWSGRLVNGACAPCRDRFKMK